MDTLTTKCEGCPNTYEASERDIKRGRRFCSVACSIHTRHGCDGPTIITCVVCQKVFRAPRRRSEQKKTCSRACKALAMRLNPAEPKYLDRPCNYCGKVFRARWREPGGRQKHCSRTCQGKAASEKLAAFHVQRKDKIPCVCAQCGKSFLKYPSRVQAAKGTKGDYCSNRCVVVHMHQRREARTSIEIAMAEMLREAAIPFREQVPMYDKWIVDFVIDELHLVVFCDGTYWHSMPKVAAKDRGQTRYLLKCGWNVLRLTDHEIKDPNACMARILAYRTAASSARIEHLQLT